MDTFKIESKCNVLYVVCILSKLMLVTLMPETLCRTEGQSKEMAAQGNHSSSSK
jgi:hypothetical protein